MISVMRQEIIRGQAFPCFNRMEFKTQVEILILPMMLDSSIVDKEENWDKGWVEGVREKGVEVESSVILLSTHYKVHQKNEKSSGTFTLAKQSQEIKSQAAVVDCDPLWSQRAEVDVLILQIYIIQSNPKHRKMPLHFTSRTIELCFRFGDLLKLNHGWIRKTQLQHSYLYKEWCEMQPLSTVSQSVENGNNKSHFLPGGVIGVFCQLLFTLPAQFPPFNILVLQIFLYRSL